MSMRKTFMNIGRQLKEKRAAAQKKPFAAKLPISPALLTALAAAVLIVSGFFWLKSGPSEIDRMTPAPPEEARAAANSAKMMYELFKSEGPESVKKFAPLEDEAAEFVAKNLAELSEPDFEKAKIVQPQYDSSEFRVSVPNAGKRSFCFFLRKTKGSFLLCSAQWSAR